MIQCVEVLNTAICTNRFVHRGLRWWIINWCAKIQGLMVLFALRCNKQSVTEGAGKLAICETGRVTEGLEIRPSGWTWVHHRGHTRVLPRTCMMWVQPCACSSFVRCVEERVLTVTDLAIKTGISDENIQSNCKTLTLKFKCKNVKTEKIPTTYFCHKYNLRLNEICVKKARR